MIDYNALLNKYLSLRHECKRIDERAKEEIGKRKREMATIEAELTHAAQDAGLETINAACGTGYWSTHYTCTVANPEAFMAYVQEHNAWNLIDKRAAKTAVREFVDETGEPPPGVNFSGYRVFNVREKKDGD